MYSINNNNNRSIIEFNKEVPYRCGGSSSLEDCIFSMLFLWYHHSIIEHTNIEKKFQHC